MSAKPVTLKLADSVPTVALQCFCVALHLSAKRLQIGWQNPEAHHTRRSGCCWPSLEAFCWGQPHVECGEVEIELRYSWLEAAQACQKPLVVSNCAVLGASGKGGKLLSTAVHKLLALRLRRPVGRSRIRQRLFKYCGRTNPKADCKAGSSCADTIKALPWYEL